MVCGITTIANFSRAKEITIIIVFRKITTTHNGALGGGGLNRPAANFHKEASISAGIYRLIILSLSSILASTIMPLSENARIFIR